MKRLTICFLALLFSASTAKANDDVTWSVQKSDTSTKVQLIVDAAKAIANVWEKIHNHHPLVRFSKNGAGGEALVPLWPYDPGSRCSPDFDLEPFHVKKGQEVWAEFEFVNISPADQSKIAFAIKADKPGAIDRYRADHDIGNAKVGNKPRMKARLATPTSGDYAYYLLDRGTIQTPEILKRNPNAAIRIRILEKPRGGQDK